MKRQDRLSSDSAKAGYAAHRPGRAPAIVASALLPQSERVGRAVRAKLGLAWRFWQETEPDTRQNLNKMPSFNGLRHSLYRWATAFKSPAGSKSSSIASKPQNKGIIDYYTFSKLDYCLYNGSFSDLSMHYGLWDDLGGHLKTGHR